MLADFAASMLSRAFSQGRAEAWIERAMKWHGRDNQTTFSEGYPEGGQAA